jgi:hypothetical protein
MSPGFRREGSSSTLGLVRETAKVGARTDTSGHPAGSDQHVVTSDRHLAQRQVHVGTFPDQQGTKSESRCSTQNRDFVSLDRPLGNGAPRRGSGRPPFGLGNLPEMFC